MGFGFLPALAFDTDFGFGAGATSSLFFYDGFTAPYRVAVTAQAYITTRLIQDHSIQVDALDVGGLPLRLLVKVGYTQSDTQNYCGIGGRVSCDEGAARTAATQRGLVDDPDRKDDDFDKFINRYYLRRLIVPHGLIKVRYAVVDKPNRVEIFGGYRAYASLPGTFSDDDNDGQPDLFPYPGSLYAQDYPTGEPGFASIVQLGLMLDSRDNEPAPTKGLWLEASARAASPLLGSTWTFGGLNATARSYHPIVDEGRVVIANRLVVDGLVGDPPILELSRIGSFNDYYVYGGSSAGRGIRVQRYLGKMRVFDQIECRWRVVDLDLFGVHVAPHVAGFVDVGVTGLEVLAPGPMDVLTGFGGGIRLAIDQNFVVRADIAVSPQEGFAPGVYVRVGNPF